MRLKLILFFLLLSGHSYSQYDTIAVAILDSMSNEISDLETCSFRFYSEFDIYSEEFGLITHSEAGSVSLKGPDKMFIEKKGDRGHKKFFYNGASFLLYSVDKNQYATMPAAMSLIEFIDSASSYYGVDFPGADVFYPDFVENLLETSNNLTYLGLGITESEECYHVAGTRDDMTYQFWITTRKPFLPVKMTVVYLDRPGSPTYSIEYSEWKLDESIDNSVFEFIPPSDAKLIKLIR